MWFGKKIERRGRVPPRDGDHWRIAHVAAMGVYGAALGASIRILDFWPLQCCSYNVNAARGAFETLGLPPLIAFPVVALVFAVLAAAAAWRGRFRTAASSLLAIAAFPVCWTGVANAVVCDPWFWFAALNGNSFEAEAKRAARVDGQLYAVLAEADVSIGLAGSPAHFVMLVYDESGKVLGARDPGGSDPWNDLHTRPAPAGAQRLMGSIYRINLVE